MCSVRAMRPILGQATASTSRPARHEYASAVLMSELRSAVRPSARNSALSLTVAGRNPRSISQKYSTRETAKAQMPNWAVPRCRISIGMTIALEPKIVTNPSQLQAMLMK